MAYTLTTYNLSKIPTPLPDGLVTSIVLTFWPEEARAQWRVTAYHGTVSLAKDYVYYKNQSAIDDNNEKYGRKLAELLNLIGKYGDLSRYTITYDVDEETKHLNNLYAYKIGSTVQEPEPWSALGPPVTPVPVCAPV